MTSLPKPRQPRTRFLCAATVVGAIALGTAGYGNASQQAGATPSETTAAQNIQLTHTTTSITADGRLPLSRAATHDLAFHNTITAAVENQTRMCLDEAGFVKAETAPMGQAAMTAKNFPVTRPFGIAAEGDLTHFEYVHTMNTTGFPDAPQLASNDEHKPGYYEALLGPEPGTTDKPVDFATMGCQGVGLRAVFGSEEQLAQHEQYTNLARDWAAAALTEVLQTPELVAKNAEFSYCASEAGFPMAQPGDYSAVEANKLIDAAKADLACKQSTGYLDVAYPALAAAQQRAAQQNNLNQHIADKADFQQELLAKATPLAST